MPGYWSLPGGTIDEVDREVADAEEHALMSCALRELFEETGVLLPPLGTLVRDEERDRMRTSLLHEGKGAGAWGRTLRAATAAFECLEPLGTMTTPPFAPLAFANRFFHAELPVDEWPSIERGELDDGRFVSAGEALRLWLEGEMPIAPPVRILLELLDRVGPARFYDAVREEIEAIDAGRLHPVFFSPGVFVAPLRSETIPPATTTNTYLVGSRRFWIVDPATPYPDEQERLFEIVDRYLAEDRQLEGILLTHAHPDHVGAVEATCERFGCKVRAHADAAAKLDASLPFGPALVDDERLELDRAPDGAEDWHLRVLHTPGHADGHCAFLDSRYRSLIAGDLASTVSTIVIDPPEGHLATYLASLRRVAALDIAALHPAHGPATLQGAALLRDYLLHREDREASLLRNLTDEPRALSDLVPAVYTDVPERMWPYAERSLLAGLIKLEEESKARRADESRWVRA